MAININTIGVSGSILLWLGVITCLGGLALFLAVSGGISPDRYAESWPLHDTYYILVDWKHRLIFLLPLVAGFILVGSGLLVCRQLPALEAAMISIADKHQEAEQDSGGNGR